MFETDYFLLEAQNFLNKTFSSISSVSLSGHFFQHTANPRTQQSPIFFLPIPQEKSAPK